MKKLLLVGAVAVVAGGVFFALKVAGPGINRSGPSTVNSPGISVTPRQRSSIQNMPLPRDAGIIAQFFKNIEERKIPEAIALMGSAVTGNDTVKQAWGVQLNAIKSVKILFIELHEYPKWKDTEHIYKVTLYISMDPASAEAPIPYYGWENGKNIRWITLIKENREWKIQEIASGP